MLQTARQSVANSTRALLSNKGRSFLTMLGIIIGVAAVIIIMSVGAGAQSLIVSQVKSLGTDLIGILPGKSDNSGPPASAMGIVITTLVYDDVMALNKKSNVPNVISAVGHAKGVATLTWKNNTYDTNLDGVMANYMDVEGGSVQEGRFFTKEEEKNLAKVAVIGDTVKKELFGESEAVGQKIRIKKHTFEIIGVMKQRGKVAFQDYDDVVFLPIMTMQKVVSGVNHLGFIRAKVDNEKNVDIAIADVETTLREQHSISDKSGKDDDFSVRSAAEALDMISTITDALKYFLAAMAALSLLVGGIGIMNIMLVSVTERTREIGLRKAIGAKNGNIMMQFLLEAVTITLTGGVFGIIFGSLVSYLISVVAVLLEYDWEFSVSISSILLAVGVSMMIGLIFGIYPARKASRLEPVEALRYE